MKPSEYFTGPEKWCQGLLYKNKHGVGCEEAAAASACALGVISLCYPPGTQTEDVTQKVEQYIRTRYDDSVEGWNDDQTTTWEMVRNVFENLGM